MNRVDVTDAVTGLFTDAFSAAVHLQLRTDTMLEIRESPQGLAEMVCRVLEIRPDGPRWSVPVRTTTAQLLGASSPTSPFEPLSVREVQLYRLAGLEGRVR